MQKICTDGLSISHYHFEFTLEQIWLVDPGHKIVSLKISGCRSIPVVMC